MVSDPLESTQARLCPNISRRGEATNGFSFQTLVTFPSGQRSRAMSDFEGWSQPVDATLYLEGEMECGLMGHRFHRGFTAAEKTELWLAGSAESR
jgi:hypothetical protein